MRRFKMLSLAALVAAGFGVGSAAKAAPLAVAADVMAERGAIAKVAMGCDTGFTRGPYGDCILRYDGPWRYWNRGYYRPRPRAYYAPRPYYGPRPYYEPRPYY